MEKSKVKFPKIIYAEYDQWDEDVNENSELFVKNKIEALGLTDCEDEFMSFAIYELKEVKRARIELETKTKIIYEK